MEPSKFGSAPDLYVYKSFEVPRIRREIIKIWDVMLMIVVFILANPSTGGCWDEKKNVLLPDQRVFAAACSVKLLNNCFRFLLFGQERSFWTFPLSHDPAVLVSS